MIVTTVHSTEMRGLLAANWTRSVRFPFPVTRKGLAAE